MLAEELDGGTAPAAAGQTVAAAIAADQLLVSNLSGLSYEEYFKRIDEMANTMLHFWKLEQRVRALKVGIQLAKLLADTNQLKLYSKKFRSITTGLDEFGRLVYVRVQKLAQLDEQQLGVPSDAAGTQLELAKHTCQNWFLKVASIRELVPRFYLELAILEARDIFLPNKTRSPVGPNNLAEQFYAQTLSRLSKLAWGFGDPIVALHARAYLCKRAERLIGWSSEARETLLFELIKTNAQNSVTLIDSLNLNSTLQSVSLAKRTNADLVGYFDLLANPLQSMFRLVSLRCLEETESGLTKRVSESLGELFRQTLETVQPEDCATFARCLVAHSILRTMPDELISSSCLQLLKVIQVAHKQLQQSRQEQANEATSCDQLQVVVYVALNSFLIALDSSDTFGEQVSRETKLEIVKSSEAILDDLLADEKQRAAKSIEQTNSFVMSAHYLRCFKALLAYANHYLLSTWSSSSTSARRDEHVDSVNNLLAKFNAELRYNRQYAVLARNIIDVIQTFFTDKTSLDDFELTFKLKPFGQLFEYLRKDEHKLDASKWVLETMRANVRLNRKRFSEQKGETIRISNKVTIDFVLKLISLVNNSVSLLTAVDDFNHLSQLANFFLDKIHLDTHLDELDFCTRCRSCAGNLNQTLEYLTRRVFSLSESQFELLATTQKRKRVSDFLNGCLAFGFVTIPAINNPNSRVELFLQGSKFALQFKSLSLADYFVKQVVLACTIETVSCENGGEREAELLRAEAFSFGGPAGKTKEQQLASNVGQLLELMLQHQDHIDLRHKFAISSFVESSLGEHAKLVAMAKLLNCDESEQEYDQLNLETENDNHNS